MKIAVPKISIFQWHPISISSSPHQHYVTLHIRTRGSWTRRLHALARKKSEISILLEGPYGSLSVDLTSSRYSMVMLLSGGIGVTPMQSIAHQLTYEHEWGERDLKKLWFVWTARDPQVMSNMDVVSNHSQSQKNYNFDMSDITEGGQVTHSTWENLSKAETSSAFISRNNFAAFPWDNTTADEELNRIMPIENFLEDEEGDDDDGKVNLEGLNSFVDLDLETGDGVSSMAGTSKGQASDAKFGDSESKETGEMIELDCYLTAKEMKGSGLSGLPFIRQSRPDMKRIFLEIRREAIRLGEKRVAICVCAPLRLVNITREACVKYSNRHVRFDFHSEVFD